MVLEFIGYKNFSAYCLHNLHSMIIEYMWIAKKIMVFIELVENQVSYIKVSASNETLKKLKQIAKLNKVLINPKFSIVDLSKIKNLQLKIEKHIK